MNPAPVIITLRFRSTNCYLIDTGNGLLAFDAGWPDSYREYKQSLKEAGHRMEEIRWFMVSHFHMDHAGLAGLFQQKGMEFVVFPNQPAAIGEMESLLLRKKIPFVAVDKGRLTPVEIGSSRQWLLKCGIRGEVLLTDGHSEDSVSLLLDTGEAFIGDLAPPETGGVNHPASARSWQLLMSKGAKLIFPAHAGKYNSPANVAYF